MRNLLIFMLVVALFIFGRKSCHFSMFGTRGTGPVQTETRIAADFHGIDLDLAGEVEVTVADHYGVEVQAQENLLPLLKTEVENGVLKIYFDKNVSHSEGVKIRVSGPAFDELILNGSGIIRTTNLLTANRLKANLLGSGEIMLTQVDAGTIECELSGSGDVEIGGKSNDLQATVSGSGEIKAKNLTVNGCKADISGSGSITCNPAQTLKAGISGSGDIMYTGSPTVESNVSGSGEVKKI